MVDRIFAIFKQYGYRFSSIDRSMLIYNLQEGGENNKSLIWVNREIARANALMESSRIMLDPDDAEIIASAKYKVNPPKAISDRLMSNLFVSWVNDVLCSKAFNGKINSIKESLSDAITKSAKNEIGAGWENSPVRLYLNQLRRHVRGEEFNQAWDNGLLSSISAVLIKGDEWEQLLNFMQSKGMNDYRIAFAMYGVLNGFANMTRDFTDLLLNTESIYLSKVYREIYGQLLEKSIPDTSSTVPLFEPKIQEKSVIKNEVQTLTFQKPDEKALNEWQNEIKSFAVDMIKQNKQKLVKSLEDALVQNGANQDYIAFITMLANFEGWMPGKKGPSAAWKRMQERFVPDYNQRIGKPQKKQSHVSKVNQTERILFDEFRDGTQYTAQTERNALPEEGCNCEKPNEKTDVASQEKMTVSVSRIGKSILEDTSWIQECALLIYDNKASRKFKEDMEWFVGNHNDKYNDKKKGVIRGCYADHDKTNIRVIERLRVHLENKVRPRDEKTWWIADIYAKIPINKIMDYISRVYGC